MATRSKSSQRWLKEHFSDPFVKKAKAEGLRSRAAYKLEELVERDRLLKPGMVVVDLGAAPGGWSQWVRQELGGLDQANPGRVIALDILEMPPLAGVEFLHGDFREDAVLSALEATLGGKPVDLVLSDMAPNKSGVDAVDMPRALYLAELAMEFADRHLRVDGSLLIKLFQGVGFDEYVKQLRRRYAKVSIRKPAASRKRSPEVYALAQGRRAMMKQF
ncbi:MAG: 23S rRNA (uridine(2552)-2'-O)-methyltransferase RlmE [Proteobacteria bacterium]|nr:23S rRNA (uridine(2552)-2'-O)-methyltransferase RlmE [Pseudomonadota bacterium]